MINQNGRLCLSVFVTSWLPLLRSFPSPRRELYFRRQCFGMGIHPYVSDKQKYARSSSYLQARQTIISALHRRNTVCGDLQLIQQVVQRRIDLSPDHEMLRAQQLPHSPVYFHQSYPQTSYSVRPTIVTSTPQGGHNDGKWTECCCTERDKRPRTDFRSGAESGLV
jgi:hypothetical protein